MNNVVSKKIYYREATFSASDRTLQQLLDEALTKTEAKDRQERLNEYEKTFRFLNKYESYRGVTFCQMLLVAPGANQPVLVYDESSNGFPLDAVSTSELTKEELKKNSDFVNSMLYFGVKDNELVVMPSQAITVRALESHLTWLLGKCLQILSNDTTFVLKKRQPRRLEELIRQYPVKSIEIGSPVVGACGQNAKDEFVAGESFSIGLAAVKNIAGEAFRDSWLSSITDEANLTARIVISYRRTTDDSGRELLSRLSLNLRNVEDADVKVVLKDYGEVKGEELNLSTTIKVGKTSRGLYVDGDIYNGMVTWLLALKKEKEEPCS